MSSRSYGLSSARAAEGFQQFLDQLPQSSEVAQARSTPATISNRENDAMMARYDNAQSNKEQSYLWALADPLSAKSANSLNVRRVLRNRSRYEYANNSYLQGTVNAKVNDLIGTGPTLKVTTKNEAFNTAFEKAFAAWAKAVNLTEKLQTAAKAKMVDGEGFLFLTTFQSLNHSVKLYPRDIECDQVTSPMVGLDQKNWVDGVVLDEVGNPAAYQLLQSHPGDFFVQNLNPMACKTVAKRFVLHWFRKDRPGQVRGIPETASTLDLWGEMRRFRKAVVQAAETAADFAIVLETDAPADPSADEQAAQEGADPFQKIRLERGMATVTPWGAKLKQTKPEQPTTTFDMFREAMLGESSRGLSVPLNKVLGTSQKFNFSSAKLDHLDYYAGLRIERDQCEAIALDPVVAAFADEAVMVPGLLPDAADIDGMTFQWHWPAFTAIDPMTEAEADTERLTVNRTKTYSQHFAEQGKDWREQFEQFAIEAEFAKKLGLPPVGQVKIAVAETDGEPTDEEPPTPAKSKPKKKAKDGAEQEEPATAA